MNECVVSWIALWRLIKACEFDFTWRLSPKRRCLRRMCLRQMYPRRMTLRRMSPRCNAETDIPDTGGTDGWCRWMALGGKAWTEGSSVFMALRPRDILLCHSSWPSQSWRQMAPRQISPRSSVLMAFRPRDILLCHLSWPSQSQRRMSLRQRKAARDGWPRDRGPQEGRRPKRMSPRWMSPRRKVCFLKHYVRF